MPNRFTVIDDEEEIPWEAFSPGSVESASQYVAATYARLRSAAEQLDAMPSHADASAALLHARSTIVDHVPIEAGILFGVSFCLLFLRKVLISRSGRRLYAMHKKHM